VFQSTAVTDTAYLSDSSTSSLDLQTAFSPHMYICDEHSNDGTALTRIEYVDETLELTSLPPEHLLKIITFLDVQSVTNLSACNCLLLQISSHAVVWETLLIRDFDRDLFIPDAPADALPTNYNAVVGVQPGQTAWFCSNSKVASLYGSGAHNNSDGAFLPLPSFVLGGGTRNPVEHNEDHSLVGRVHSIDVVGGASSIERIQIDLTPEVSRTSLKQAHTPSSSELKSPSPQHAMDAANHANWLDDDIFLRHDPWLATAHEKMTPPIALSPTGSSSRLTHNKSPREPVGLLSSESVGIFTQGNNLKNLYAEQLATVRRAQWNRHAEMARQLKYRRDQARKDCFQGVYGFFHLRCITACLPTLLLITTVLAMKAVEEPDDWSASQVMIPLFVALGLLTIGIVSVCCTKYRPYYWLFEGISEGYGGCLPRLSQHIVGERLLGNALMLIIFSLITTFFILFAVRLDGVITVSYGIVFIPLWLAFLGMCFAPCTGWYNEAERVQFALFVAVMILAPLLVFSILLVVRLDGDTGMKMQLVSIPFWVIYGFYLVVPLMVCICTGSQQLARKLCNYHCLGDCSYSEFLHSVTVCFAAYVIFLPLALFQIFLTLRDNDQTSISATSAFVPMLVWQSLLCLGSWLLAASLRA
jgi:Transmembrane Fragile-X-F protein